MTASRGRTAVFLDRDGTIATYQEYCRSPEAFDVLPGVGSAIRKLNEANLVVIVMTNQSAIGRGWLTMDTLAAIHDKMQSELTKYGARVDAIYVCPHHPEDGCGCRKPGTLMLTRAAQELELSLVDSYVIGDRVLDVKTGQGVGSTTILVQCGHTPEPDSGITPDYEAPTLTEAVEWVLHHHAKRQKARSSRPVEVVG